MNIAIGISAVTLLLTLYLLWKINTLWKVTVNILLRLDAMRIHMGATHEGLDQITTQTINDVAQENNP